MSAPKPPISTHILDTSRGQPAAGVNVIIIFNPLFTKVQKYIGVLMKFYGIVANSKQKIIFPRSFITI